MTLPRWVEVAQHTLIVIVSINHLAKTHEKRSFTITAASIASNMNRESGLAIGPRGNIALSATFFPSWEVEVFR